MDDLPSFLKRNSFDYYYLSVYPSLKGMRAMDGEGAHLPNYPERITSAYLHTPFCSGICDFCSYFVQGLSPEKRTQIDDYFELVKKEVEYHQRQTAFDVSYIYFGGGTPSLIPNSTLERFFAFLQKRQVLAPSVRGTLELHPEFFRDMASAQGFLDILKANGIQRVSVGFESSSEELLHSTNRRHDTGFLVEAIDFLRTNGMLINLDLMYGLPGLTNAQWEKTLNDAANCQPDSIATYFLFVDPGTVIRRRAEEGRITLPSHRASQVQHLMAQIYLESKRMYELPNDFYARPESDPTQFTQEALPSDSGSLPLGAGSYGFYDNTQFYNQFDLKRYRERISGGESPIWRGRHLDTDNLLRRDIMFSFKNDPHIKKALFRERYGCNPEARFPSSFELLASHGLIKELEDTISLTPKGRLCVEEICSLFTSPEIIDDPLHGVRPAEKGRIEKHNFAPTYSSRQLPLFRTQR